MNIYQYFNKDFINKYSFVRYYARQEVIAIEGNECNYIGFIDEGNIIISTLSYQDKEEIINTLHEHQFFGNNLLFASQNYYLGTVIAKEHTRIRFFTKDNFLILLENKEFLKAYLRFVSDEAMQTKNQAKLLAHKNIRDRIMYYLKEEARKKRSNTIHIRSITYLSSLLSLPRPSVAREIKNMRDDGLITYNNKTITIVLP